MSEQDNQILVFTHEQLARRTEGFAVRIVHGVQAGRRVGEPDLYLEIQPEGMKSPGRVLYVLDRPDLVSQVANARLLPGAPYLMRANGTTEAPKVRFDPLPETSGRTVGRAEHPRCDSEDLLLLALVNSLRAVQRAEKITGLSVTPEVQALASTLFISQKRDGGDTLLPGAVARLLSEERGADESVAESALSPTALPSQ
jgi:hypothetical protein